MASVWGSRRSSGLGAGRGQGTPLTMPSVLGVGSGLGWSQDPGTRNTFLGVRVSPTSPLQTVGAFLGAASR